MTSKSTAARLLEILFCPPKLIPLFDESCVQFPESLTPAASPRKTAFHSIPYTGAGFRSVDQEVPAYLDSPNSYYSSMSYGDPHREELEKAIQYKFSNGVVLTSREILFHPLAPNVPDALLPIRSTLRPDVEESGRLRLFEGALARNWFGEAEMEKILLSVLLNAGFASVHSDLRVLLMDSQDREHSRKGLLLRQIGIAKEPTARWFFSSSPDGVGILQFRALEKTPDDKIFSNLTVDDRAGVLNFQSSSAQIEAVNRVLRFHGDSREAISLRAEVQGHQKTQRFLEEINSRLASANLPRVELSGVRRISSSEVTPQLWLDSTGAVKFSFQFQTEQGVLRVWNFPNLLDLFIPVINRGIGAASKYENRELAQRRRGIKRERDLRVLKHSGLAALLFHEINRFVQETPQESANFERKLLQKVMESLGRAVVALDPYPDTSDSSGSAMVPSLDRLCSRSVNELVENLVSMFSREQDSASLVLTTGGIFRVEGLWQMATQVLQAVLQASLADTGPVLFTRARTPAFESFLGAKAGCEDFVFSIQEAQAYGLIESHRSLRSVISAFIQLIPQGFEFYWNGKAVHEAGDSDLQLQMKIIEPDSSENQLQGAAQGTGKIDWFELHPQIFFRGTEIEPSRLHHFAREGLIEFQGKYYVLKQKNLPQLQRLEEFWNSLQEGKTSSGQNRSATHYLLPRSQALDLLALRASGARVEGGPEWASICAFYDSLSAERSLDELPDTLRVELKPYQRRGVQWLLDLHRLRLGGILADDMGLGKTIQTLAFLEKLRSENRLGKTLIVVPTSLTYNWKSEAARFAPDLPVEIFQTREKEEFMSRFFQKSGPAADLVCIVTYGLFLAQADFFSQYDWNLLIFDEAQNLKNIASKRTTQARSIQARFKLCLTGTPLENHLGELFSLLDLTVPGCLGSLTSFREKFVNPELIQPENVRYLKLKAKPLILRRTKTQILTELPPKTESRLAIPFERTQQKIYRDIALSWNEKVKNSIESLGEAKSRLMMLTALLRLRQACSDPAGVPGVRYAEIPPKLSLLLESLEEITESGESALVFTQFLHTLHRFAGALAEFKIPHYVIHGGTSRKERERILREFSEDSRGSVLLMTLKTGGVGLNLVKASYVFHVEPWWNPAVENQATDRAHRMGQTRPVQVFRYIMHESVEEKIELLKDRKSARFNAVFSEAENEQFQEEVSLDQGGSFLTQADFSYLLS